MYIFIWYLFNKIAVGLNKVLNRASEPGVGTPDHAVVHSGEHLSDEDHQAGLDTIRMTIGMSLKFALDKIAHKLKFCTRFGCFMAIKGAR